MNTKDAAAKRIIDLCNERGIAVNAHVNLAGILPSTVYSMHNSKSKNPVVVSLNKICAGLDISLRKFFASDIFDGLDCEDD